MRRLRPRRWPRFGKHAPTPRRSIPSHRSRRRLLLESLEDRRLLAAGDLDLTFDADGRATGRFITNSTSTPVVDIAVDSQGRTVVAGATNGGFGNGATTFTAARFDASGVLDTSFDTDGRRVTTFNGIATAVAVQGDDRVVLVGSNIGGDFVVGRLNVDGSTDTTFGTGGLVTTDIINSDSATDVAIQSDGKIVVVGRAAPSFGSSDTEVGVVRYNADGSLDTSFDTDGIATVLLPQRAPGFETLKVAIQPDGKIVVGGTTRTGPSLFQVVRFNTNGSLDTSFDGDGILSTTFGPFDATLGGLAVQADGKIVAAGFIEPVFTPNELAVVRYNADGSLDTSFSGDGRLTAALAQGIESVVDVRIDSSNRLVVAGQSEDDYFATRILANGSLDQTFGENGSVLVDLGTFNDSAEGAALTPDGKLVIGGGIGTTGPIGLVRLLTAPTACPPAGCFRFDTFDQGEVEEDAGAVQVVVQRIGGSTGAASVDFATEDGTATAGQDYDANTGTLQFANGETMKSFTVMIRPDTITEGDETIRVRLSNPTGGAVLENPRVAQITIAGIEGGGQLDTTFGGGGSVALPIENAFFKEINDVVFQPRDGKLISVVGEVDDFFITRHLPDGTLDFNFGGSGVVQIDFQLDTDEGLAAAVLPNDQVLVVGYTLTVLNPGTGAGYDQVAIARINPDGTLDRTFGDVGRVVSPVRGKATDVKLLDDGRFVVALRDENDRVGAARFLADGSVDPTFGTEGVVFSDQLLFPTSDAGSSDVVVQSTGAVVVSGVTFADGDEQDEPVFSLARFTPTGQIDTTFGVNGLVTKDVAVGMPNNPGRETPSTLVLHEGDKLLLAGTAENDANSSDDAALVRFNADGTLDTTFGDMGVAFADFSFANEFFKSDDLLLDIAIQPNNKILVFAIRGPFDEALSVGRLQADGSVDGSFGNNGIAFIPADLFVVERGTILVQDDNRIVIGARSNDELTLYRFTGEPAPGRFQFPMSEFRVDENAGTIDIPIQRRSGGSGTVTVEFLTDIGGTATADVDYTTTVQTVTFSENETFKTVTIPIGKQAPFEGPETVNLRLRNPTGGATLGTTDTAVLTIFDGPGRFQFTLPQFAANESAANAPIFIERIDGSDGAASVTFTTSDGTATAGDDYQSVSTTVNFANGQTIATVNVPLLNDLILEGLEKVNLALSNPTGGAALGPRDKAVLNIFDIETGRGTSPGSFDPPFGDQGIGRLPFDGFIQPLDMQKTAGGKYLLFAQVRRTGETNAQIGLARFNADGTVDTSFGTGGIVVVDFDPDDVVTAMAQQADGKIVVSGYIRKSFTSDSFVARLNADGSIDTTFGTGGRVVTDFDGEHDSFYGVTVQPDGKVIAVGTVGGLFHRDFAIARYNAIGSLDNTFGTGGKVTTDFNGQFDIARDVTVLPNNKIVVVGASTEIARRRTIAERSADVAVAQYNPDGTLDNGFGTGGIVNSDFTGVNGSGQSLDTNRATRVLRQPDGKLLVSGFSDAEFLLGRYNPDGTLDRSFGDNGFVEIGFVFSTGGPFSATEEAFDLTLDEQGRIIIVGRSGSGLAMARYLSDGRPDLAFGASGEVLTGDVGGAVGVVAEADGTFVTGGAGSREFQVARFLGASACPAQGCLQFKSVSSGGGEGGNITVTVVRPVDGSNGEVTVDFFTADGTARAGQDYTPVSGTLTFKDTVSSVSFQVPILDDTIFEGDERFSVILTNPQGGAELGAQLTSILVIGRSDQGSPIGPGTFSISNRSVDESAGTVAITVSRFNGKQGAVSVDFATTDGTAVAGEDYLPVFGTLKFADNETSKTINLPILADTKLEADETLTITLSNPTGGADISEFSNDAVITILDTDPTICVNAGALNTGFSGDGLALTDLGQDDIERIRAVAEQPDGKIVAVGRSGQSGSIGLVRYNIDGTLDTTFGTNGIVRTDIAGGTDEGNGVLLLPGGKIMVLGESFGTLNSDFVLVRYNADGSLDNTFGTGGIVKHNFADFTEDLDHFVLLADGKILAAGSSLNDRDEDVAVARFNADGSLDNTFGVGGQVTYDFGFSTEVASGIDVQSDGKIVLLVQPGVTIDELGTIIISGGPSGLMRLNPDGSRDATFGGDGFVSTTEIELEVLASFNFFDIGIGDLTILGDDSILLGGSVFAQEMPDDDFLDGLAAVKLMPNGGVDTTFGQSGAAITNFNVGGNFFFPGSVSIAVQTDGRIVLGSSESGQAVATRFFPDGVTDIGFGAKGRVSTNLKPPGVSISLTISDVLITQQGRVLLAGFNFDPRGSLPDKRDWALVQLVGGVSNGGFRFRAGDFRVAEDGGKLDVHVDRVCGVDGNVSVTFETFVSNGAQPNVDFGPVTQVLNFAERGPTTQIVSIPITDNTQPDGDRAFSIRLVNPTGGAFVGTPGTAEVTIADDEKPGTIQFTNIVYTVNENGGTAMVTLERVDGRAGTVSVQLTSTDDTATAGQDYDDFSQVVTFGDRETTKTITVTIHDDQTLEDDEHVALALSNPTGGAALGFRANARLTIIDDEIPPPPPPPGNFQFSMASYNVNEDGGSIEITVNRVGGTAGDVEVGFTITDGTATDRFDYVAFSGTLLFPNGVTTQTFGVPILNDKLQEATETINLTLLAPDGDAGLDTPATAVINILDDDQASADLSVSVIDSPDPVTAGGTLTYQIDISNAGPDTAASVTLSATLPAGVTFVSASPNGQSFTATNGTVTGNVGDIPSGAFARVTIVTQVAAGATGPLNFSATATSTSGDPVTSNNTGTAQTAVQGAVTVPNITATKDDKLVVDKDGDGKADPGDTLGYTITISNIGNGDALGVILDDLLDQNLTLVPGSIRIDRPQIDTTPFAVTNTATIFGENPAPLLSIATVGQTFRAPAQLPVLNSFTFFVNDLQNTDTIDFQGFVMQWNVDRAVGPVLFQSPVVTTTNNGGNGGFEAFTFDTGALSLMPGVEYVAFISTTLAQDAELGGGTVQQTSGDTYADGKGAFLANGTDFSLLTTIAWGQTVANTAVDLAFQASFSSDFPLKVGDIAPGESVGVSFQATVNSPFPQGIKQVANQGTVSGDNFSSVSTDDPATPQPGDPTITPIDVPIATTVGIVATSADKAEGNAGHTPFTFTVTRGGDVSGTTTVDFAVTGSGANPASAADFGGTLPVGQITFAANETTKTVTVNVNGDTTVEPDETFTITLSNASGGATINTASAAGTIRNDDAVPTTVGIFAASADKAEGNASNTAFTFTINRGGDTSGSTTVNFAVTGSGANPANAADFGGTLPSGQVSFAAIETTKTVTINVRGDTTIESDETFTVTLSNASGASILTGTATGTIRNDDSALAILPASADKFEGNSGNTSFTFSVTRTGDLSGESTANFAVTGSGANPANAADFGGTLPSGQVSFAANESTKSITINVSGDTTIEPDEMFTVTLSNTNGGPTITTPAAVGTIRNDDFATELGMTCTPLQVGLNTCTVIGATPGGVVDLVLGTQSGSSFLPQFNVTVAMTDPTIVAQGIVQPDGRAVVQFHVASAQLLQQLLLQAFEQAPIPRTSNIVIVGAPLLAAKGEGSGASPITTETIPALLAEATARWRVTGLSAAESQLLDAVSVEVTDLPSGMLGRAVGQRVFLDRTAAGHGWFVDPTPADDREFESIAASTEYTTAASSPAAARIDLLTAIMHELGHVLGRDDAAAESSSLMSAKLPVSTRRLPAAATLAEFDPLDVNRDGHVSPIDALLVINQLGQPRSLVASGESLAAGFNQPSRGYDVNGDGDISPVDAMLVINYLNRHDRAEGEDRASTDTAVLNEVASAATPAAIDDDLLDVLAGGWYDADARVKKEPRPDSQRGSSQGGTIPRD